MARIARETIERIAAATDIVALIGGYFPLKRAGSTYRALCPFHDERTPSFHVNPSRQRYHCFGCGADGSVFDFVMAYEHLDFTAAAKRLAEKAGIPVVEEVFSAEEDRKHRLRQRLLALHGEAADWFHAQLIEGSEARAARKYLKARGIGSGVAKSWRLGYAPDSWDAFSKMALGRGFTRAELIASGLVKKRDESEEGDSGPFYDRFRGRIQIPICDEHGNVVAFSGRICQGDGTEAKYVNSPETPLFTKGRLLFGLHRSKRAIIRANSVIVCEGQIDLITAFESGIENVTAPQGTAFTSHQARLLRRFAEEIILCFDADAAGEKAASRSLPILMQQGFFVRVARMPEGHDPDSLIRTEGYESFLEQVRGARDYYDDMVERAATDPAIDTPREKVAFARRLAEALSWVKDVAVRDAILKRATQRLQFSETEIRLMLPDRPVIPVNAPPTGVEDLCGLALRSDEVRQLIRGFNWKEILADEPEGALLVSVLNGEFTPGDPASVNEFMAGMAEGIRRRLGEIYTRAALPVDPEVATRIVNQCWRSIESRAVKRRQELLKQKLQEKGLPLDEVVRIQKEILDLNTRFADLIRPFP